MVGILTRAARFVARRLGREPRYPDEQRIPARLRTLAGVLVTPDTAVTVPAVWACLRYLSQTVAVLPWHVMRDGDHGAEIQSRHPVDWLLYKRSSPEWSSFQFRETLTHWALRWGNGYAEIEMDVVGRPIALWPLHPERTQCCRAQEAMVDDFGDEIAAGALFYEVDNGAGGKVVFSARRIFHIRGFGEGPVGVNVMHYAAESIGWARAAQLFGASFFGNGLNLGGVVTKKKGFNPEGLKRLKTEFDQLYRGVRNANKVAFLDDDMEFKTIGVEPEKAQFLETNQHLVAEIARWFGVPPHKIMDLSRATFSNIEHQAIEVVVDSVSPWVKRFEDEADSKLFGQNRQGLYTKMNMRALMRADVKTRGEYYRNMRNIGAYSVNRILELEDENTIGADGDKHVMQGQYTTLEQIGNARAARPAPALPAPVEDDETEEDRRAAAQLRAEAEAARVEA
jgi:HK97 family phage portal protein